MDGIQPQPVDKSIPAEKPVSETRLSLEERLQPKLDQAEYLLVLVLAMMLWTAGFVDLFTHTSRDPAVLGLYSLPYFGFLLVYCLGFVFWSWLIFPADSLTRFKRGIRFIQERPWLGITWFLASIAVLGSMFVWERWMSFPLLEASMALLILLALGVILVARPVGEPRRQPWRQALLFGLGSLLAVELGLQALSLARLLPFDHTSGMFTHYGRIYQNEEGFAHGRANQFGFYYPAFELAAGSPRILFTGDSFIQALQIDPEQHMGKQLEEQIRAAAGAEANAEVLAIGLPGYGAGLYLNLPLYPYTVEPLQPEEVIVFFHLANDFQTLSGPGGPVPYYRIDADGEPQVHPDDFGLQHTLQHLVIRGFEPINTVRTASSNLFLFGWAERLLDSLGNQVTAAQTPPLNMELADANQPFGTASFMFSQEENARAEEALELATGLLAAYQRRLEQDGVQMRLVTIPYFPAAFYEQYQGAGWSSEIAGYDLLRPERELAAFAQQQGIPVLPMGAYLQASGASVEEIRSLFFQDGTGHLTPAGHTAFARAVYGCFYAPAGDSCP